MMVTILLFLLGFTFCFGDIEPACSKFDYEEKILAKTIRLEYTVDDLAKRLTKVEGALEETATNNKDLELKLGTIEDNFEHQNTIIQKLETKVNATQTNTGKPRACPSHYLYNATLNLCWRLEKSNKKDWWHAEGQCFMEGGHLIILNSMATFHFIQSYLKAVDAGDVFVGAADFNEEGNFKWANGDPVQQTMWRHSDPNGGSAQNCVAIYSHSYSYKLTDEGCSNDYEYLCQIPLSLE